MLKEHSTELSNSLNELLRYITILTAWNEVIIGKNIDEKYEIIIEFVAPIAALAINLPYAIRSRFIYSVTHLSHQANRTKQKKWVDDLRIDREINFDTADKYSSYWKRYRELKLALEKIANKKFQSDTHNFRDKYNHRYSLKIEIGITEFVKRNVGDDGRVSYGIGFTKPLKIDKLLPVLKQQYSACFKAFAEYQRLVEEQISVIKESIKKPGY